ncbi:phosphatase [Candidatus Oleimmundimicrobium sp.]|uniref:phosphatase n=1 Tax=Candidatus Oleimmundimicrobium sp. TaxID=3060597 RepID=UPI0027187037|nr:phosphatase [Candidatus Oleimmundimicrobium sp.]MDO8885703.1 phosphatase [Candidatus Oleimmundimicrobium sp.]
MKLLVDLHTHTVASGHAYSTVMEMAKAAKDKGLEGIAITDHGPALPGGAHPFHFWNLRVLPKEIFGVRILKGAEANIVNLKGELDLEDELLETLDVVLLAFHPSCGYEDRGIAGNTKTMISALKNPNIHIIAHPGNPSFPVDAAEVIAAAKEYNAVIELNNSSLLPTASRLGSYESCLSIANEAYKSGSEIVVSSDAHIATGIGNFDNAINLALKAGFSEERILNSSINKVLNFLKIKSLS